MDDLQQYSRRDCLEVTGVPQLSTDDPKKLIQEIADTIGVAIEYNDISTAQPNLIVGCVYRHPSSDIEKFTIELKKVLQEFDSSRYQILVLGDINIDFFKYVSHPKTEEYLHMLYD